MMAHVEIGSPEHTVFGMLEREQAALAATKRKGSEAIDALRRQEAALCAAVDSKIAVLYETIAPQVNALHAGITAPLHAIAIGIATQEAAVAEAIRLDALARAARADAHADMLLCAKGTAFMIVAAAADIALLRDVTPGRFYIGAQLYRAVRLKLAAGETGTEAEPEPEAGESRVVPAARNGCAHCCVSFAPCNGCLPGFGYSEGGVLYEDENEGVRSAIMAAMSPATSTRVPAGFGRAHEQCVTDGCVLQGGGAALAYVVLRLDRDSRG